MNSKKKIYQDAQAPLNARAADLLSRMSLEEKVAQMRMCHMEKALDEEGRFAPAKAEALFGRNGFGVIRMKNGTTHTIQSNPREKTVEANRCQRAVIASSRHGIPALMVAECLHGYVAVGATIFPQAVGLASSWNPDLVGRVAEATAREARSTGVHQALSPMLDIAHDPRWGRTEESYGEDPHLASRLAVAFIRGLQGDGPVIGPGRIGATVKHFAAHGRPETGLNLAPVAVGEREFRSVFLPPYRAGVVEAGALSVMPAYHELDGIPCHASRRLLHELLREEWGFEGYVISDFIGIRMLHTLHRVAADLDEAGRLAVEAGVDVEAPEIEAFGDGFVRLVREGVIDEAVIDRAVTRILRAKFLLGLFDGHALGEEDRAAAVCHAPEHRALALEAARQAVVLLKNDGGLLPLSKTIPSLAVLGPNADAVNLGGYSGYNESMVSVLEGIRALLPATTRLVQARGCGIYGHSREGFAEAVDAARACAAAVVVVGESKDISCEGKDNASIELPGVQETLVREVAATGTPTVVVVNSGRPMAIEWIAGHVPAIIQHWYGGEAGGTALAEVLFGDSNPSGRLPITIPRSTGHIPSYYNHKPSARGGYGRPGTPERPGRDFALTTPAPLFPFGHGLGYTVFAYEKLRVEPSAVRRHGRIRVRVDVQNTGDRAGDEVVQLYLRDEIASVTTPVKALKAFRRIGLAPGERKTVEFVLGPRDLALLDRHMEWTVEAGFFTLWAGGLEARFEVLADNDHRPRANPFPPPAGTPRNEDGL